MESELDRLESDGVIERTTYSEWAAPIVAVPKRDGRLRLCGDYKVTVNPVLNVDQYCSNVAIKLSLYPSVQQSQK